MTEFTTVELIVLAAAWQTARPTRSNSVSPGKRSRSYSVSRLRDPGANATLKNTRELKWSHIDTRD